jgi:hypothetical protein
MQRGKSFYGLDLSLQQIAVECVVVGSDGSGGIIERLASAARNFNRSSASNISTIRLSSGSVSRLSICSNRAMFDRAIKRSMRHLLVYVLRAC